MRKYFTVILAIPALIVSCAGSQAPAGDAAGTPAVAALAGNELQTPGTWSGEVPCADCPAIRMTLTLRPDGVFLLRRTYVGAADGRDESFVDRGRWAASEDGRRLVLRGGTEAPRQFAVVAPNRLRMLNNEGNEIRSRLNYELVRASEIDPIADRARLRGMFRYMADAARYTDCLTGQDVPVAMTADYLALERVYLAARTDPGAPLLVTFAGHLEMRPAMEGDALEETVVVEQFDRVWPGEMCGQTIEGKTWRLIELSGQALAGADLSAAPFLVLDAGTKRVHGSTGCNRLSGSYELDGNRLRFGALATTRMACPPEVMAVEQAFLRLLEGDRSWGLQDGTLILVRGGQMVARFAAGEPSVTQRRSQGPPAEQVPTPRR
ncbi:MAG: META domain-containing protein [Thermoanaerobaculaceae bacterium]|nr:META domain-containing protein [Thermoanaerobaculaceae bacterium]